MRHFKKIFSLIASVSMLMASAVIPTTIHAENDTPDTPLYLFRDTLESRVADTSSALVNGIWESSAILGGTENHDTYGIYAESYANQNKVIGITPEKLGVLNLVKDLGDAKDYVYSVDMKLSNNLAGIRLANNSDDTSYYELAIVSDEYGYKARFSKVMNAAYDTPITPDDWQYVEYSNFENLSADTWLTLSLAKQDTTLYWSVYNKTADKILSSGSFTDQTPLFTGLGRLQLFAYARGETDTLTLFDNIDAKRLGAEIYEDKEGIKIEASWINNSENQPLIAVADYDKRGRMVSAETFENRGLNNGLSSDAPGYFICETPLELSGSNKKLFVLDGKNMKPIYDCGIFTDIERTYTEASRFAILLEDTREKMTPDGEFVYGAEALYGYEETTLYWKNDNDLMQGNAIFFTTDTDGFVTEEFVIYNKMAVASYAGTDRFEGLADYKPYDWVFGFDTTSNAGIRLLSGVITDVTSNSITFGRADENGNIDFACVENDLAASSLYTYGIADGCNAYEYDSQALGKESSKYGITDPSAIYISELVETSAGVYSVTDPGSTVTNAVALIVNGDVVCIYAIY